MNVSLMCSMQYNYYQPYVEVISIPVSNNATFDNMNDLFENLSLKLKQQTDKEEIFYLYKDCIYFGEEENKKLNQYIIENKMEVRNNIFDYYD